MPNLRNASKALRQEKKRTEANAILKRAYKKAIKQVLKKDEAGDDVTKDIHLVQKKLGKAVKRGILKKGAAARKLSRLTKRVAKKQ